MLSGYKKIQIILLIIFLFSVPAFTQTWNNLINKADSLFEIKQYDAALQYAFQALDYAENKEGKESKPYASSANLIGNIYFGQGKYYEAIKYFNIEKEAKKKAYGEESPQYAKALHNLSSVLSQLGHNREAEPILLEALELKIRTLGANDTSVANSANNLGAVCFNIGKYNDAEQYYLMALKIREEHKDQSPIRYAMTLNSLGSLYKFLGNYSRALKYLKEAYDIYSSVLGENDSHTAKAMSEIAITYLAAGEADKAHELLEKHNKLIKKLKGETNPEYFSSLYNMAMYYWSRDNLTEAMKILMSLMKNIGKKMGNGHPLYSSCLNSIGLIYWQMGNLDSAGKYLTTSERLRALVYGKDHLEYATALQNLAAIQKAQGKYEISDKNYKKVVQLYIEQINKVFPGLSESEKAKFYTKLQERFELYNLYVLSRKDVKPGLLADMYYLRQVTKGILLNASRKIKKEILNSNNPDLINKFNQWNSLKTKLARLYTMRKKQRELTGDNIGEIEEKINELEKYLSANSQAFSYGYTGKAATWEQVRNSLQPDEAAVEIIRVNMFNQRWLDSSYYVALIITPETQEQPDCVLLDNGYELEHYDINYYLNSIRFQLADKFSYNAFWEKIEKKIGDKHTIYISQDGIFNKINVATLMRPDGNFVIDDKNIVVVSKTSDIVKNTNKEYVKNAYLFGDPKYAMTEEELQAFSTIDIKYPILSKEVIQEAAQSIPELPGTEKELSDISSLLKQKDWNVTVYKGIQADEYNFKRIKKAGVLHVATHGYFIPGKNISRNKIPFGSDIEKPINEAMLNAGLLFSGATNTLFSDAFKSIERENGILTAYEASSLTFDNVKMLVLSACETGLGEIKNGEGVYGLQRAFLIAGVKDLVMTLWKVNDYATSKLMTAFYSNWLSGKSVSESMRAAQLQLKEEFPNPYFWGAFVVVSN